MRIIPVRMPGADKLVIVLRVNADAVLHPVLVAGKVIYRVPGHSVPADRQRLLDLIARDAAVGNAAGKPPSRMAVPTYPWQPMHINVWPPIIHDRHPNEVAGELRVVGGLTLPSRIAELPSIDSRARQAARDVLNRPKPGRRHDTSQRETRHRGAPNRRNSGRPELASYWTNVRGVDTRRPTVDQR